MKPYALIFWTLVVLGLLGFGAAWTAVKWIIGISLAFILVQSVLQFIWIVIRRIRIIPPRY